MKKILHLTVCSLLLMAAIFMAGCKTADQADTGQLASLQIDGHSEVDILRAMKAVFLADGYIHTHDLIFERKGSTWDSAAYSDIDMGTIWLRIKASVDPVATGGFVIGCDAYMVNAHNQGVMESEQKLSHTKRSECKTILGQSKARLDSGADNSDKL